MFTAAWSIAENGSPYLQKLYKDSIELFDASEEKQYLLPFLDFSHLNRITMACTQAMIANIVSRLVQETMKELVDMELDTGILLLFSKNWSCCSGFMRYIVAVMEEMSK
jgi:hypothetical protein